MYCEKGGPINPKRALHFIIDSQVWFPPNTTQTMLVLPEAPVRVLHLKSRRSAIPSNHASLHRSKSLSHRSTCTQHVLLLAHHLAQQLHIVAGAATAKIIKQQCHQLAAQHSRQCQARLHRPMPGTHPKHSFAQPVSMFHATALTFLRRLRFGWSDCSSSSSCTP